MALGDVLVGGVLAIAGGAGATILQAHLQSKARAEERDERRREVRRDQAQRVFEALYDLLAAYQGQQVFALEQIIGRPAGQAGATEKPAKPSAESLQGIISIYFPTCRTIVDDFDKEALAIGTAAMTAIAEHYVAHPDDPDYIKRTHFLMVQQLGERASKFSADLRDAMQTEIARLW